MTRTTIMMTTVIPINTILTMMTMDIAKDKNDEMLKIKCLISVFFFFF